ncbi:hypothetical protein PHYBOEH_007759 [Phytophthora boehmeriae]|uniref:RxLR effector protein n=1 Tax=Phytophthora boehmeriae TaxID=109152 RepID=A0A8T1W654_9STRA|nr:hypothetical protein PHYBOEH_007759 [Phytophthora boehmeriae]
MVSPDIPPLDRSTAPGYDRIRRERSLRVDKTTRADGEHHPASGTADIEDRGFLSSLQLKLSSAKENVLLSSKAREWANNGKADDYVKSALGLEGLSGTALTSHKNFKYFQKFQSKLESRKVNGWLYDDVPSYDVWIKLGLDKIPEDKIKSTTEYKTYKRYVNTYADHYEYFPQKHALKFTGTNAEKTAKTKQRQHDPEYKYFEYFLKLTGKKDLP